MLNKKQTNDNDFAERFYRLRRSKKLTQKELGDIVGLHHTHIGKYERGLSKPTSNNARLLADALGVTVDHLMQGEIDDMAKSKLDDRELLQQFQEVEKLPDDDKIVVKKLLDAFLTKKKVQALVR